MVRRSPFTYVVLLLWGALVLMGMIVLVGYQSAPGKPAQAPKAWPVGTTLPLHAEQPSLLVFAHPQCVCTRASISELERLLRYVDGRVQTSLVFLHPQGFDDAFVESALWKRAQRMEGVLVHNDTLGAEAARFQSFTSGQTLLYSSTGELLFSGGLTASRGHEGDNIGRQSLQRLILDQEARVTESNVFGCPLEGNAIDREDVRMRIRSLWSP